MAQLSCNTVGNPRLDPTRVISAGLVIRRVYRAGGSDRPDVLQAWMRSPLGRFQWRTLDASTENLDPDPTKRAQPYSGRSELDQQLAAIALSSAMRKRFRRFSSHRRRLRRPGRTIAYGIIPTASGDVSDAAPGNGSRTLHPTMQRISRRF